MGGRHAGLLQRTAQLQRDRVLGPKFKRGVEFLERATAKLKVVVPFTLGIIFVLLYLTFRRVDEAALIMATLPFALVGGGKLDQVGDVLLLARVAVGLVVGLVAERPVLYAVAPGDVGVADPFDGGGDQLL